MSTPAEPRTRAFSAEELRSRALTVLDAATEALGGEVRPSQVEMTEAVADALSSGRHLFVEAPTGTGKTIAYLAGVLASGKKAVVATATKNLQDQLVGRDLVAIEKALAALSAEDDSFDDPADPDVTLAVVVKGRSNYICQVRLAEAEADLSSWPDPNVSPADFERWLAEGCHTRDDLPQAVPDETWAKVSISAAECAGRECPFAARCPAMQALALADQPSTRVVVTNHALYGAWVASDSGPAHDVAIFDEAHSLADSLSDALAVSVHPRWMSGLVRRIVSGLPEITRARMEAAAFEVIDNLRAAIEAVPTGRLLVHRPDDLTEALTATLGFLRRLYALAASEPTPADPAAASRHQANMAALVSVGSAVATALNPPGGWFQWRHDTEDHLALVTVPVRVDELFAESVLSRRTAIFTSATLRLADSFTPILDALGADTPDTDTLALPSPFDLGRQGLLYLPQDLPQPNSQDFVPAAAERVVALVEAAGGRALVLTTSWAATNAYSEALRAAAKGRWDVFTQGDMAKPALAEAFRHDETSVLVATMGFWEGFDVPGRSLELVVLDKIPFPRPDDPLWVARGKVASARNQDPFSATSLPRAAILLAQGAGRLLRTADDYGVIAVLDPRLSTARYGPALLAGLEGFSWTHVFSDVADFFADLAGRHSAA